MHPIRINSSNIAGWFQDPEVKSSLYREYELISDTHDLPGDLSERVDAIAQTAIPPADSGSVKITPSAKGPPEKKFVIDFTSDSREKLFSIPLEKLHSFPQLLVSIRFFEKYTLPHVHPEEDTFPPLQILKDLKEVQDRAGRDIDFSDLQQAINALCFDNPDKCKTDNAQENIKFATLVCILLQHFETPPDICPRLCAAAIAALESPFFQTGFSHPLYSNALLSFATLSPDFEKAASRFIHKYLESLSSLSRLLDAAQYLNFQEIEHISLSNPTKAEVTEMKKLFPNLKSLEIKFTSRSGIGREERNKVLSELNCLAPTVISLDFSEQGISIDTALACLKDLTTLTSLNLGGCIQITDDEITTLASLSRLTELNLASCDQITDDGIATLASLSHLAVLNLNGCSKITDDGIATLASLSHLIELRLGGCIQITDDGIAPLASLSHLTKLSLSGCWQITDAGIAPFAYLSSLTDLNLSKCGRITNTGLASFAALSHLTHLNLRRCYQVTDDWITTLASFSCLIELSLAECSITDDGIAHLADLSRLTTLNLEGCTKITDAGLATLASLSSLTELNLAECRQITDAGIEPLASLSSLTELNLSRCLQITDAGIALLATLSYLNTLNLSGCRLITDAGIAPLATLSYLNTLNLYGCTQITAANFEHLKNFPALTEVDLRHCRKITQAQIDALVSKLHKRGKHIHILGPEDLYF